MGADACRARADLAPVQEENVQLKAQLQLLRSRLSKSDESASHKALQRGGARSESARRLQQASSRSLAGTPRRVGSPPQPAGPPLHERAGSARSMLRSNGVSETTPRYGDGQ